MSEETMSEDAETVQEISDTTGDDQRFEVKWKKKEQSATRPLGPVDLEPSGSEPEDLRKELDEAQQRIRDLQERWQRSAADLANLRRRTEQERGEMEQFASMVVVAELLPVLDNFERALATIPGNLSMLTWIQGIMLIERHVRAILEHQGLEEIDAQGQPFSPHLHEAVGEKETADESPGTIVQVYQKGYTMHGRVIRPSLVEIAKEPAAQPAQPESATGSDRDVEEIVDETVQENSGP